MADQIVLDRRVTDLTGQRFEHLTVLRPTDERTSNHFVIWECECACGAVVRVSSKDLLRHRIYSCGCVRAPRATRAGMEYSIWTDMKTRCYNRNSNRYKRYGARGIKVCDRWLVFANFLTDMGPRPSGMTLDRINNDRDYSPDNCRWASNHTQIRNSSKARMLTHDGFTMCISEWAERTDMPDYVIERRLNQLKWTVERALTEPVHSAGSRSRKR